MTSWVFANMSWTYQRVRNLCWRSHVAPLSPSLFNTTKYELCLLEFTSVYWRVVVRFGKCTGKPKPHSGLTEEMYLSKDLHDWNNFLNEVEPHFISHFQWYCQRNFGQWSFGKFGFTSKKEEKKIAGAPLMFIFSCSSTSTSLSVSRSCLI